jgi:predicted transcriptional regulator
MIRTQIYITEAEQQKLHFLAKDMDMTQSALIREAIDQFIAHKLKRKLDRQAILQSAKGLWSNRDDLPDFDLLRKESNRNPDE